MGKMPKKSSRMEQTDSIVNRLLLLKRETDTKWSVYFSKNNDRKLEGNLPTRSFFVNLDSFYSRGK